VVPGQFPPFALICAATFGNAAFTATHIGTLTDLFSAGVLARITGVTGVGEGVMNMTLMLATGMVVDRFSYLPVFMAAGLLPAAATVILFTVIRRIETVA
jgi:MFS transporter, ACS family, hexuronate transporter